MCAQIGQNFTMDWQWGIDLYRFSCCSTNCSL